VQLCYLPQLSASALLVIITNSYTQRSRDWFIARGQFFVQPTNGGDRRDLSTSFSMTYKLETLFFKKKAQYIVD
jgi:hypothetical protein